MKQLYYPILLLTLILSNTTNAQTIQYDLQCSSDGNSYEVYVSRDITTTPVLFAGSSTITLVLPTGNSRTVSHTSESVSTYNAVTPIIDGNGTGNDFYAFNTSGGSSIANILTAGTPVLWLTLTPSDGTNQDARLFINGSDPNNIGGVNPSNEFSTLSASGIVNEYDSNVSDIVINCSTLSTEEPISLTEIRIYPNPVKDYLNIEISDLNQIEQIRIYDLNGRVVIQSKTIDKLNVSKLSKGAYILDISSTTRRHIRKFIKE